MMFRIRNNSVAWEKVRFTCALKSYVFSFRDHWERLENPAHKDSWYIFNGSGMCNEAKGNFFVLSVNYHLKPQTFFEIIKQKSCYFSVS